MTTPRKKIRGQAGESIDENLSAVVEQLCSAQHIFDGPKSVCYEGLPSREVLRGLVERLRSVLFPGFFGPSEITGRSVEYHVGSTLDGVVRTLQQQIQRGFCFICCEGASCADCEQQSLEKTHAFLTRLPEVHRLLMTDVQAHYEGDPAATSPAEAVFCYPGLVAITNYRIAHELQLLEVPLIPRMITEQAHSITGIDIHPGAAIGENFFIDHGTGVVIGETTVIGNNVKIYHGVTLGARSVVKEEANKKRHPTIEDGVTIYPGATILGGETVIGKGSIIGGNVWLLSSVPPYSKVYYQSENLVSRHGDWDSSDYQI